MYDRLSSNNPASRKLGHIVGGSVVFLGAFWEQYAKGVMTNSVDFIEREGKIESPTKFPERVQNLTNNILKQGHELNPLVLLIKSPTNLPKSAQGSIVKILKRTNQFNSLGLLKNEPSVELLESEPGIELLENEWGVELVKNDWSKSYKSEAIKIINKFDSLSTKNVLKLFEDCIGIDGEELVADWSYTESRINQIVGIRNSIAHTGLYRKNHLRIEEAIRCKREIMVTVKQTDNFLCEKLKSFSPTQNAPWKKASIWTEHEKFLLRYTGLKERKEEWP